MKPITPRRILAIDPGMQYVGAAVLEGEEILWFGVKTFPGPKALASVRETVKQYLAKLIATYQPTVLVVEDPFYAQSTLSRNLTKLTSDIKTWGRWRGLQVESYVPPVVKAFFCRDQRNKQSLAEAMVAHYPFLSKYLTVLPWRRRYWFHVFDAVGLGLMCQQKLARRKISL